MSTFEEAKAAQELLEFLVNNNQFFNGSGITTERVVDPRRGEDELNHFIVLYQENPPQIPSFYLNDIHVQTQVTGKIELQ